VGKERASVANLNADQKDELTFLTGVDENGVIAKDTWASWSIGDVGRVFLWKWNNDAGGSVRSPSSPAGTGGGTVRYGFAAGLSAQEQAAYEGALALYSDIANIQFQKDDVASEASLLFKPKTSGTGDTYRPSNGASPAGMGVTQIPSQIAPNAKGGQMVVGINAPVFTFNSFSPNANFTLDSVVHEVGHVLGLGHGGRYNGDDYNGQNQFGAYDSRLWSIESYVDPDDQRAKYYSSYPVTGTNWTTLNSGVFYRLTPQTPMALDILAVQRIYGASTSSTFAGGQTYGFNTNIAGGSKAFYDFRQNLDPVVTIYNRGSNNTLDLSGYSTNSTVNLNPGTFSSASFGGRLVNNICIAYDTRIDTAIGGKGNDVFRTNGNGDTIDGGGGNDRVLYAGAQSDYVVSTGANGSTLVTNKATGATDRLTNIEDIQFGAPLCFTTGTRIAVIQDGARREIPVERLQIGDLALTAAGGRRAIRWIGHRTLGTGEAGISPAQWPVRVLKGGFGRDADDRPVPVRDLHLSPGHPVLVRGNTPDDRGVLVPIMCFVNGTSIARRAVTAVTYWHVELETHDILLAEGLAAESYIDGGDRAFFTEASDHALHDPDRVPAGWSARCRSVVVGGPVVEAERQRLDIQFATALHDACAWPSAAIDGFLIGGSGAPEETLVGIASPAESSEIVKFSAVGWGLSDLAAQIERPLRACGRHSRNSSLY
jgi:serralysin